MLAKPEYSSPPDEVCCWLGRRDRAVAGRGAAAKSHLEDAAGRGAVAEILLPGRAIGKKMLAGDAVAELLVARHLRKRHLLPTSIKQERATLCGYPLLYLHYVKLSDCQQRHW